MARIQKLDKPRKENDNTKEHPQNDREKKLHSI